MEPKHILKNPETGINVVCLIISAAAPALAIGPAVGIPTGAAIALGLIAVIKAQRNHSQQVRRQYFIGAWAIRIFAGCFEQMAYSDQFAKRDTLPFQLDATSWAWIATVFMALIDLWAYQATAAKAAAEAERIAEEESYARVERMQKEKERAEMERKEAELKTQIEIAKIQAEADTRKETEKARKEAEARKHEAEKEAEARKIEAETKRKLAEIEAETKRKEAEEKRKDQEIKRKQEEENRKREEERRKQAEAEKQQKEAEKRRKEEEEAARQQQEIQQNQAAQELKKRWAEAQPEERRKLIPEAEEKLTHSLGRKPTRAEVAAELGTTDRTVRTYANAA